MRAGVWVYGRVQCGRMARKWHDRTAKGFSPGSVINGSPSKGGQGRLRIASAKGLSRNHHAIGRPFAADSVTCLTHGAKPPPTRPHAYTPARLYARTPSKCPDRFSGDNRPDRSALQFPTIERCVPRS
jgi:hypothetical protein